MFPAWIPYQPVNFSQDISVTHEWMRCQPSPAACLHPTGRAGKGWVRPQLPSHPISQGCVQPFQKKKAMWCQGRMQKVLLWPVFALIPVPPSLCWDGQEQEQNQSCGERRGASRQGRGLLPTARRPCHQHILKPQDALPCMVEWGHGPGHGQFPGRPHGEDVRRFQQWKRNCSGWDTDPFTYPVSQQLFLCSDPGASTSLSNPAGPVWRRWSPQWFIALLMQPVLERM